MTRNSHGAVGGQPGASLVLPAPHPVSNEPRPTTVALLDHLDPTPACPLGPIYNIPGAERRVETVCRPLAALDEEQPNFIRNCFLNPVMGRRPRFPLPGR
ncbi:MmyB family transcriptional regulator [Streptomyces sp. KR55]|uniref:MmyB family transcriptional regulator n=1 Tax=Streptomyces sp. KR55 TaxID=3457425 RepID=UPI003FCF369C